MQLEYYSAHKMTEHIKASLAKHLKNIPYKAFYFGSRVNGTNTDRSDIDVGIWADEKLPFILLGRIREDLENLPTLYTVDVVDFNRVSSQFLKVASEKMEPIL